MISRVHQKLGTAGFVISIVALVMALTGGAYAASGALTGKQKKEVEKIAKKSGKPGPAGASGAAGPAGPKGDAGAEGKQGPEGKQGAKGLEGEEGPEGSPWTLGGTLPSGATETGAWSASGMEGGEVYVPISFPIPLKTEIPGAHLVVAGGEAPCTGTNIAPTAPKGVLCLYETAFSGATSGGIWDTAVTHTGSGVAGSFLILEGLTSTSQAYGAWAVTAP